MQIRVVPIDGEAIIDFIFVIPEIHIAKVVTVTRYANQIPAGIMSYWQHVYWHSFIFYFVDLDILLKIIVFTLINSQKPI